MRFLIFTLLFASITFYTACSESKAEKTASFKVYGNCDMCKKTIEGSLDEEGISKAEWNKETKLMTIVFDSTLYTPDELQQMIANSGYDTESKTASDDAYTELPECCQYKRKNEN